jgi:hypothetical protein
VGDYAVVGATLTLPAVADTKQGQFLLNRLLRSEKVENRQIVFEVVRATDTKPGN